MIEKANQMLEHDKRGIRSILASMKQPKAKLTKFSVGGKLKTGEIYELAKQAHSEPFFIVQSKGSSVAFKGELQEVDVSIQPYRKVPWVLPTEPIDYGTTTELWNEVKQCLYEHIDLPDAESYNVFTAWIFASWLVEKWSIAPYIFAFGSFGTGKTRIMEVASKLSLRGWLALYMSTASLYRPVEAWHPTLFLDEAEVYGNKHEMIGLLNGSYRKGQYVARQKETDGDYETEFFDCFSFKGIAGTKELAKTLQSRCIMLRTSNATRKIKFFIDENRCTELRNKLLQWRFDQLLEDNEQNDDILKSCETLVEKIGNQREVELFYPLIAVAPTDEIKQKLIEYAKSSANAKLEELSLTTEATCLTAILTAKERGLMKNGRILISEITGIANETLGFNEQWKERFTSSHCARLGFQKTRGTNGKACIIWSVPLIDRLKKDQRYALCFSIHLETPSIYSKSSNQPSMHSSSNWLTDDSKGVQ